MKEAPATDMCDSCQKVAPLPPVRRRWWRRIRKSELAFLEFQDGAVFLVCGNCR